MPQTQSPAGSLMEYGPLTLLLILITALTVCIGGLELIWNRIMLK